VTRAVLTGFLGWNGPQGVNNINVRSVAQSLGLTVEEKRSDESVTFNEWLHVQLFRGNEKLISAGGTFFGSPNNPRIVRLHSTPVEVPVTGVLLLLTNSDRPGIVGFLGTVLAKHQVNIANMSLGRDTAGGKALTVLNLDSVPSAACLAELENFPGISNVRVVTL
jgi:D-3-phosphoglycerate dehydrogenase